MTWTLVTGGAKNLGAEICRTLAKQKHNLVVHYHTSKNEALEVASFCHKAGVQAEILQGDFSTQQTTEQFTEEYLERFAETQCLVNNVGNYFLGSILETPLPKWYELIQNNLFAPLTLMQRLMPSLKQHQGAIVNIGVSGVVGYRADLYASAYTCAKQGLCFVTKSMAKELASEHVRVNMVSPGYLETAIDLPQDVATLPMRRAGTLMETAQLVAYLLSPEASYITGQNIEIAGGLRL